MSYSYSYTERYTPSGSGSYSPSGSTTSVSSSSGKNDSRDVESQMEASEVMQNNIPVKSGNTCTRYPFRWLVLGVIAFLTSIVLIIVLSLTFHYVKPTEYALDKNTNAGQTGVDTKRVYSNGRYGLGPGHKMLTFPATVQTVYYDPRGPLSVSAFTDTGLEFQITCSFQFWLVKDAIGVLYEKHGETGWRGKIETTGLRALKNMAPSYTLIQYINNRPIIKQAFYESLQKELEGLCGTVKCIQLGGPSHFQINEVIIPEQIKTTWLNAGLQEQLNEKQQNDQAVTLVRLETTKMDASIRANITLVNVDKDNTLSQINANTTAYTSRLDAEANGLGIGDVITSLGITNQDEISRFLRILTVRYETDDIKKLFVKRALFADPSTNIKMVLGGNVDTLFTVP